MAYRNISREQSLRRARKPEILAPVGGHPQLVAAIENGADAVYFGLSEFNARARAHNFSPEELPEVMAQLHERGVLGFVTFNTLLFDEELHRAERYLRAVIDAGVDSLIVQDLGVVRLIRQISPDIPIHGSTQMTVTSAESAELIGAMGVERVVLARELSAEEITWIARHTDLELEVFVHGALCVSYSGQCFSSEAWGGRSANRGQCAQACRMPYDLIVDGQPRPMGDYKYLLSPQDLMGVDQITALVEAGVSCFKIEGRLKGPEYVALTTRTYREAVDRAWARQPVELTTPERRDLTQIFSRGLTPGFLEGVRHQRLVEGRAPRHRGVYLGQVRQVRPRGVLLELENPLKRGDGLVFDAGRPQEREEGGRVYEIFQGRQSLTGEVDRGQVELRFGPGVDLGRVSVGDRVWKTRDEALEARLRQSWEHGVQRRSPVDALASGRLGEPLRLVLRDEQGHQVEAQSQAPLQAARGAGLDQERLRRFVGRLGQTPLELRDLSVQLEGELFLPTSQLNELRRQAADALLEARRGGVHWSHREEEALPGLLGRLPGLQPQPQAPALTLLCRTPEQVEAALELEGIQDIYLDFLEIKGIEKAVKRVQAAGRRAIAAAPRILKPREERIWRFLLKLEADAILVRGLGLLHTLAQQAPGEVPPLYGDYSLNATNALTVDHFLGLGLERLTPGHDLNAEQLCHLATCGHAGSLELILHHHLPVFHTEHCVFCRFLSDGDNYTNCGRPCEEKHVHLRDHQGLEHVVLADMGCRNTVFNAQPQSGARHIPDFLQAGYRRFRVELLEHKPEQVAPLVEHYRRALGGDLEAPALWRWLETHSDQGVTLGSLLVGPAHRDLKPVAR